MKWCKSIRLASKFGFGMVQLPLYTIPCTPKPIFHSNHNNSIWCVSVTQKFSLFSACMSVCVCGTETDAEKQCQTDITIGIETKKTFIITHTHTHTPLQSHK